MPEPATRCWTILQSESSSAHCCETTLCDLRDQPKETSYSEQALPCVICSSYVRFLPTAFAPPTRCSNPIKSSKAFCWSVHRLPGIRERVHDEAWNLRLSRVDEHQHNWTLEYEGHCQVIDLRQDQDWFVHQRRRSRRRHSHHLIIVGWHETWCRSQDTFLFVLGRTRCDQGTVDDINEGSTVLLWYSLHFPFSFIRKQHNTWTHVQQV